MTTAESDFGYVHFDHFLAVVVATLFVETAAAWALVGVQNYFNFADGFFGEVVQLQEHRAVAALQFAVELHHHLATPVIAFNEALTGCVGRVTSKGAGHIRTSWAVVVFDQRVDLVALQVG